MKPYINQILAELPARQSAAKNRVWLFEYVRDIPYAYSNNTPEEVVVQRIGDCRGKSRLLAELLETQGIQARFVVAQYKLMPFPDEVRFIPSQLDYHHVTEFCIGEKWVLVDPTYDPALNALGFVINEWDGETETDMCVRPLAIKLESVDNSEFDHVRSELEESLRAAFINYPCELMAYRSKFNDILAQQRRPNQQVQATLASAPDLYL